LHLCEKAGLAKLGHVALDGTKIKANASKHKAMSYGRMEERAAELEAEVAKWLGTAEAADAEEDKLYGHDKTGEEMPDWVADKQRRAEKIRQAKAWRQEAKAAAEAKLKAQVEAAEKQEAEGRRKVAPPSSEPEAKAQKNFTDPQSRIMKSKDGFVQAYNAQAAVDAEAHCGTGRDPERGRLLPTGANDRCDRGQSRPQARAAVGRFWLLLGGQSRSAGSPQHRWLCGDRPGQRCCCRHCRGRGRHPAPSSTQQAETPTRVAAMRA
jgi:hypothetical protein